MNALFDCSNGVCLKTLLFLQQAPAFSHVTWFLKNMQVFCMFVLVLVKDQDSVEQSLQYS